MQRINKFKYGLLLPLLVLLPLMFIPISCAPAEQPTLSLRIASPYPEANILTVPAIYFSDRVEELTEGRITFNRFWGTLVAAGPEVLESTSTAVVDICVGLWIYAPGKIPLGNFEYNFLFNDPDRRTQSRIKRQMFEEIPELNEELANFNLGPSLVFAAISSYDILSKTPIETVDDLKGKRVAHTPVEFVPVYESAGAVSVISPAPAFYERLERGVCDAASLPLETFHAFKNHEVAKHHTTVGLCTPTTMTLWINRDTWQSLTAEDQKLFMDIGKETDEAYASAVDRALDRARADFTAAGVTFYTMSKAETEKWRGIVPDIPGDWAREMESKGLPGWEIVERYIELSKEAGWEFPREWGIR